MPAKITRAALALLTGLAGTNEAYAARARGECEAYGKIYGEGGSYTISTGEFGTEITYVCFHGTWQSYEGGPHHR